MKEKKWIHCFEDVLMVMFLAALSEYDQVLEEDGTVNRMTESLNLFGIILAEKWFQNAGICLFLNKKDLLQEKIKTSPLEKYFPSFKDYNEFKSLDYDSAKGFIKTQYEQRKKDVEKSKGYRGSNAEGYKRSFFIHETCATDTENVRRVFSDVKVTVFHKNIASIMY